MDMICAAVNRITGFYCETFCRSFEKSQVRKLRKLLSVEEIDGVPYVIYDYTSEVEFQGVITIPVTVTLENPWQKELEFTYNVIIKGYNN